MARALILAGGLGTRSADPSVPKVLQPLGPNDDLLSLHCEQLMLSGITDITLLLGHEADKVKARVTELEARWPALRIEILFDQVPNAGTVNPVLHAVSQSDDDEFILVLGDVAIAADYRHLVTEWTLSGQPYAVCVHPNLHPEDSDRMVSGPHGTHLRFVPKGSSDSTAGVVSRAISGISFFTREFVIGIETDSRDVARAFVELALERGELCVINTSFYMKDTGTPARLEQVQRDFESGAILRRGRTSRGAIFLDRDGTLIPDAGTTRNSVTPNDVNPDTVAAIRDANDAGIPIFIVTNQPGVAKGHIIEPDVLTVQYQLEEIFRHGGALIDDFRYCPHHPERGHEGEVTELKIECVCRKPAAGMARDIAERHGINLSASFVIGDTFRDEGLAAACGSVYLHGDFAVTASVTAGIRQATRRCLDDHH